MTKRPAHGHLSTAPASGSHRTPTREHGPRAPEPAPALLSTPRHRHRIRCWFYYCLGITMLYCCISYLFSLKTGFLSETTIIQVLYSCTILYTFGRSFLFAHKLRKLRVSTFHFYQLFSSSGKGKKEFNVFPHNAALILCKCVISQN